MPYANYNEAFIDYSDTYSSLTGSSTGTTDLRNPQFGGGPSVGQRYGQLGGANGTSVVNVNSGSGGVTGVSNGTGSNINGGPNSGMMGNISKLRQTFDINYTDPADDFPNIAANYQSDGYNTTYSSPNEWSVLDPQIKGVRAPTNPNVYLSPDKVVNPADAISPVTQQRTVLDKLWERPTSSEVDDFKLNERREAQAADRFGGIGTAPGQTARMISAPPPGTPALGSTNGTENLDLGASVAANAAPVSGNGNCGDQECMDMLDRIMKCEECVKKLRNLLGISGNGGSGFFGMEIPEINLSKLMFWVIVVILIVAVYELLNTLFARFR